MTGSTDQLLRAIYKKLDGLQGTIVICTIVLTFAVCRSAPDGRGGNTPTPATATPPSPP